MLFLLLALNTEFKAVLLNTEHCCLIYLCYNLELFKTQLVELQVHVA